MKLKVNEFNIFFRFLFYFFVIDHSSAGVTWGIVVALTLVGVIVFVSLYFRRRVQNLKTEIAHVQYIADPQSQPDRHHFDNPVYAFQPTGSQISSVDSATLLNNLRPSKTSNLGRQKLGYSDTDSNASSRGITIQQHKFNSVNISFHSVFSVSFQF